MARLIPRRAALCHAGIMVHFLRARFLAFFLALSLPMLAQPLVHLRFDNPADLAADSSGHGRNGTANGNVAARGNGVSGGAAQFDGASYIALDQTLNAALAGNFTLSLWLETTGSSGEDEGDPFDGESIVAADDGSAPSAALGLTGSRVGFGVANEQGALRSSSAVNTGNFVHVVVTQNAASGERAVFVNGQLEATHQVGGTISAQGLLALGATPSQARFFAGAVDDFQVYDQALNASAVAFLHANPGSAVALGVVPEPASLLLLALGAVWIAALQWQRWRNT